MENELFETDSGILDSHLLSRRRVARQELLVHGSHFGKLCPPDRTSPKSARAGLRELSSRLSPLKGRPRAWDLRI